MADTFITPNNVNEELTRYGHSSENVGLTADNPNFIKGGAGDALMIWRNLGASGRTITFHPVATSVTIPGFGVLAISQIAIAATNAAFWRSFQLPYGKFGGEPKWTVAPDDALQHFYFVKLNKY